MLLVILCASIACSSKKLVPDIRLYREIPFLDAPEALYVNIASDQEGLLTAEEYEALRPYLLMIDPEGVRDLQLSYIEACRKLGQEAQCSVTANKIQSGIKKLDDIVRKMMER